MIFVSVVVYVAHRNPCNRRLPIVVSDIPRALQRLIKLQLLTFASSQRVKVGSTQSGP